MSLCMIDTNSFIKKIVRENFKFSDHNTKNFLLKIFKNWNNEKNIIINNK